jgi:DNA helicase-2/ATP-dependent DNA helicase PcrA
VLALTFTTKAATEMRERVDQLVGGRADRAHLSTFHSFAGDIVRQHGTHVGLRPDFKLLTLDEDRIEVLEDSIAQTHADGIPGDRKSLLRLLERLFADSYDGGGSTPSLAHVPAWLPGLFEAYLANLRDSNRLDFGALLHVARHLLATKPGVARALRLAWTHVCVDEFQDTNRAQYDFLRLLIPEREPNLFVVADDDQLIYQWNGASPERLQVLERDYGMTVIQLPENYRCPPAIVALANSLIQHNTSRAAGKKPLVATRATPAADHVWCGSATSPDAEASDVASAIKNRNLPPEDCVVLARTAKVLESVVPALEAAGFEAYLPQRKTEFESDAVRWLFNLLRLANGRHDRELLRRVSVAWGKLMDSTVDAEAIAAASVLVGGDFLRAWCDHVESLPNGPAAASHLALVRRLLVERLDYLGMIEAFLANPDELAAGDALVLDETATWRELHEDILREYGRDESTLHLYLQEMDLRSKVPGPPPRAVRLLTVHGSKGLEFKHVFLIGMAEDVFPSFQAVKRGATSGEMEEERRNCFVAITRVQESLTLSWSQSYYGYRKQPSRFLREMGLVP